MYYFSLYSVHLCQKQNSSDAKINAYCMILGCISWDVAHRTHLVLPKLMSTPDQSHIFISSTKSIVSCWNVHLVCSRFGSSPWLYAECSPDTLSTCHILSSAVNKGIRGPKMNLTQIKSDNRSSYSTHQLPASSTSTC